MRLTCLLLAGVLASIPAAAQEPSSSPSEPRASSETDAKPASGLDLPVSLDKIRGALERPAPPGLLKSPDQTPTFRIEIRERQKIEELLATLDFKSGPTPAGGLYAYEQQRLAFPSVDNPLAQPYAAFSQGELLTILVENLVGKYLAGRAAESITKAVRERAEAQARREVDEAIAEYCSSKPNAGAGIQLCAPLPTAPR